jgi:uncharacterized protein YbaR (Trm112 family)
VTTQPIPDDLLRSLVDPLTREPVKPASAAQLADLQHRLAHGGAQRRDGGALPQRIDGAFVTADGHAAYPVLDGLPHFLVDERIELDRPLDGA